MTPEARARLRIEWHREGHPDTREPRWAGLFQTGTDDDDDSVDEEPLEPASDVLILSGCGLQTVPPEVFEVEGVTSLMLGNQPLGELPGAIARMTGLEQLDLSFTQISTLPDEVFLLPRLTDLHLQGSALRQLPASLPGSPLKMLTLDACPLESLPDFGGQGARLEVLTLAGCGRTAVPDEVATAPHLIQLDMERNPLSDLSALTRLRHLLCLQLSGCGLTELPGFLADLPFDEAFARVREKRRIVLARRVASGDLERFVARPLPSHMGLRVGHNPFKDKALAAAAELADAEERTFALQDWCRRYGA